MKCNKNYNRSSQFMLFIIVLLFCLALTPSSFAAYYADLSITINEAGTTFISGTTNHPSLKNITTQQYTSKEGKYWILNITLNEPFSTYIYTINLPKEAEINYMKLPTISSLKDTKEGIAITAIGENKSFYAIVQYSINTEGIIKKTNILLPLSLSIFIIGFGLIGTTFIYYRKKKKTIIQNIQNIQQNIEQNIEQNIQQEEIIQSKIPVYDSNKLTERELKIVSVLEKQDGKITQSKLEEITHIPKASLSRNLHKLAFKEVIEITPYGMTNMITFRVVPLNSRKN